VNNYIKRREPKASHGLVGSLVCV